MTLGITVTGLLLPGERKSVEPIASIVAPWRVWAEHQSLLAFRRAVGLVGRRRAGQGARARRAGYGDAGRIEAWIVDDTGFGRRAAFGGRGATILRTAGKTDNCQVAVTLSIANHHMGPPVAYRLYLPKNGRKTARQRKRFHTEPHLPNASANRAMALPSAQSITPRP